MSTFRFLTSAGAVCCEGDDVRALCASCRQRAAAPRTAATPKAPPQRPAPAPPPPDLTASIKAHRQRERETPAERVERIKRDMVDSLPPSGHVRGAR